MITTATHYRFLSPNPKSAYKQLFVSGTRIRARVLYGWFASDEPMTPEEIAADYGLPVEAVDEAIAYCESQPPELAEDYSREEALMQATGMNEPNYKDHPAPASVAARARATEAIMKLYLDDDCASRLLARLLRQAGHQVELPIEAELSGATDPVHLTHALREGCRLLTANFADFHELHDLIRQAGGHHPGILSVRRENNPKRDLSPQGIVRAIAKLEAAELSLEDQFVILNQWR